MYFSNYMLKPRGIVRGLLLTLYKPYKKATFLRAIFSYLYKPHIEYMLSNYWAHLDTNLLFEGGPMEMPPCEQKNFKKSAPIN